MVERQSGTRMVKSLKLLLSKREKRTQNQVESCQIEDGSVSLLCYVVKLVWQAVGNTRVISQTALDHFRTALKEQKADPYSVLLRRNKLPMGLLEDESKTKGKVRSYILRPRQRHKLTSRTLTLSRLSHSQIHSDPKPSVNDLV
jgi:hypothetical protein